MKRNFPHQPTRLRALAALVFLSAAQASLAQPPATQASSPAVALTGAAAAAASAPASDLAAVLQTIAARSPDVLAAQAAKAQADAQVQQARAAWFGKVDAYATSQHYNDPRLTRAITLPPNVAAYPFSADQFGYGLNAQLPIDLSGQIAAEVDAARARAAGAQWSAADMRLRALLQGATLYRNLQALAGQRQALDRQLQSLKTSERVAEAGLKVGNIARVDLLLERQQRLAESLTRLIFSDHHREAELPQRLIHGAGIVDGFQKPRDVAIIVVADNQRDAL